MKIFHNSNKDGYWFPEEGMFRVAEVLTAHHKENIVDYTQKYGLTSQVYHAEGFKEEQPQLQPVLTSSVSFENTAIYKELREYLLLKIREEGIKPYYIYNNNQLEQIVMAIWYNATNAYYSYSIQVVSITGSRLQN